MRGLFVTFEGVDGAGKSTQLKIAAAALRARGYEVVESREPGGTQLAEEVRALVLAPDRPLNNTTQTLLYLAARSEHVDKVLRPAFEQGKIVLCDRFSDSTLVYQGLAAGKDMADVEELRHLNAFACGDFAPDLTLVFDGDPENLLLRRTQRGVTDRYEQQGLAFQQALRKGFLALAAAEPQRIRIIQAEGAQEEVAQEVQHALEDVLYKLEVE